MRNTSLLGLELQYVSLFFFVSLVSRPEQTAGKKLQCRQEEDKMALSDRQTGREENIYRHLKPGGKKIRYYIVV